MSEAKVTRIAIGRLHNLGNYEHIRYDVTVELTNGERPSEIITGLERMLGALAPVKKDYDYQRAVAILADPEKVKDETERNLETYRKRIEKVDAKLARRHAALEGFDNLNGVSVFTDAKSNWEDDDYDY